jgi:non-specific serine/threonine protein kinase
VTNLAADRQQRGNLPADVTTFVGRRKELAEAKRILENARLVTLTGVGGVGKTRLALRVAADVQRTFADGVWLAELSALRDAKLLPRTVAMALELSHSRSADDPVDVLADYLADRHLLLILDTCEHLVDACAMLTEVLLRAAPRLKILTTSREPLAIIGESTLLVPPLDIPNPERPVDPDCDSVALFTDRARATVPGFVMTPQNERAIVRLCQRLDGIPLAIELATVRLHAMSVDQIVDRLDNRFQLLGTTRTSLERHQTLRAAIEWSHDLCTPQERLLWARLSVFPGGFDLAAAEYVCADDELPADAVLDTLSRLVGKSILLREQGTAGWDEVGSRYRMLDTIREYGTERLGELGAGDELRRRHRDFYLRLADEAAGEAGRDHRQLAVFTRLRREQANLRVALDFSLDTPGEELRGLHMSGALHLYWAFLGLYSEGRNWLARALAAVPDAGANGRAHRDDDRPDRGQALYAAARLAAWQGDFAVAETHIGEAGRIADELDDPLLRAKVVHVRGLITFLSGDDQGARPVLEESLAAHTALGWPDPIALSAVAFAAAAWCLAGQFDRAVAVCEDGLSTCEATGERWCRADILMVRALARWMSDDPEPALIDLREALRTKETYGDLPGIAMSLDVMAGCAVSLGEAERAAVLFGATEVLWESLGAPFAGPSYGAVRDLTMSSAEQTMGAERFATAHRRGAGLPVAAAIEYALGDGAAAPAITRSTGAGTPDPLTRREQEVAGLVAQGLSNREIAERLVIAKRTVDSHLEHILAKLGFTSRTQIAAWAASRSPD